jgi:hypothetical protein
MHFPGFGVLIRLFAGAGSVPHHGRSRLLWLTADSTSPRIFLRPISSSDANAQRLAHTRFVFHLTERPWHRNEFLALEISIAEQCVA